MINRHKRSILSRKEIIDLRGAIIKHFKRNVSLLILVLAGFPIYGQEEAKGDGINLPSIIPPSPVTYQLGEYGQIPVSYFTGNIKPEIPLLTYSTSNLDIPVSLNYHSSGIKVDQLTSNVGLGWSMNSGGVVTRVVRGEADEKRTIPIPQEIIGDYRSGAAIDYFYSIGDNVKERSQPDSEIDIFSYNFLGYSGQFVLDHNLKPVLLTPNGLQIDNDENGFLITDTNGVKYYFLDTESSKFSVDSQSDSWWSKREITGWYLSKIIHPKGDEVYFTYSPLSYTYDIGNYQSLTPLKPTSERSSCPDSKAYSGYTINKVVTNKGDILGVKLESIDSNRPGQGKIVFSYKNLPVIDAAYLVSEIKYLDASNKTVESATFGYLTTPNERTFLTNVTFSIPSKKYSLEYNNAELMPERLSYSQDHWGYFNGKSNRYFFPNPSKIAYKPGVFELIDVGADKEPDPISFGYGTLKKIIYPTKGFTVFEYEGNTYHGTQEILPPSVGVNLKVETDKNTIDATESEDILNIEYDQRVDIITKNIRINDYDCDPDKVFSDEIMAFIKIENLTKDQSDIFGTKSAHGSISVGNRFTITPDNKDSNIYMSLLKGCDYRISISVERSCMYGGIGFTYHTGEKQFVDAETFRGGVRISKITNLASPESPLEIKKVYYGKKETLSQSSGVKGFDPWYFSTSTVRTPCGTALCSFDEKSYAVLNSSSVRNLFNSEVQVTRYRHVTVGMGENFENGGDEYEYYVGNDIGGRTVFGSPIEGASKINTGWDDGLQKKVSRFKSINSGFITLYEKTNTYIRDPRKDKTVYGFNIRKKFALLCTYTQPDTRNLENLDIMEQQMQQNWFYKKSSKEIQYDENGNNPVSTVTDYLYENPVHLQPTQIETSTSDGETLVTKTFYPDDVTSISSLEGGSLSADEYDAIGRLKKDDLHRISSPIQKETWKNGVKLSTFRTSYKMWYNSDQSLQPELVQSAKGNDPLQIQFQYHSYDYGLNPIMISKEDGPATSYFWGYNGFFIAKVENATQLEIAEALGTSIYALKSYSEANLPEINSLREKLPKAMVTTYTYDPLIGMTSMTDPNGITTYYEYDGFGRLQSIRDHENNILKEYEYNYKDPED